MQQIIVGVIIGAGAILIGPRLISDIAGAIRPVGEDLLHFGETAVGTVTSSVSAAGEWVGGLVGLRPETTQASSPKSGPDKTAQITSQPASQGSESDKEEESFLEEAEDFGKEFAVKFVEEEAISFIKLALLAIV